MYAGDAAALAGAVAELSAERPSSRPDSRLARLPLAAASLRFPAQPEIIQEIGSYAGLAAVVGPAVLVGLYFSQARDVKRLREWAGRAPERARGASAPTAAASWRSHSRGRRRSRRRRRARPPCRSPRRCPRRCRRESRPLAPPAHVPPRRLRLRSRGRRRRQPRGHRGGRRPARRRHRPRARRRRGPGIEEAERRTAEAGDCARRRHPTPAPPGEGDQGLSPPAGSRATRAPGSHPRRKSGSSRRWPAGALRRTPARRPPASPPLPPARRPPPRVIALQRTIASSRPAPQPTASRRPGRAPPRRPHGRARSSAGSRPGRRRRLVLDAGAASDSQLTKDGPTTRASSAVRTSRPATTAARTGTCSAPPSTPRRDRGGPERHDRAGAASRRRPGRARSGFDVGTSATPPTRSSSACRVGGPVRDRPPARGAWSSAAG